MARASHPARLLLFISVSTATTAAAAAVDGRRRRGAPHLTAELSDAKWRVGARGEAAAVVEEAMVLSDDEGQGGARERCGPSRLAALMWAE